MEGELMNPFTGTWVANIAKSRRHHNHQFESATLRFAVAGDAISLTQSGVNMSGKHETSTLTLRADGQEHAVSPQAPGVVVVTRWLHSHAFETVGKRGADVLGRGTYVVTPDGKTLTASVSGIDASGAGFEQVIVFDRG
jgi:hypothetical protein